MEQLNALISVLTAYLNIWQIWSNAIIMIAIISIIHLLVTVIFLILCPNLYGDLTLLFCTDTWETLTHLLLAWLLLWIILKATLQG